MLFPLPGYSFSSTRWLPSLRPLLKCYLLGQVFPDHPIYICTHAYPLHSLSPLQAYFPPKHL